MIELPRQPGKGRAVAKRLVEHRKATHVEEHVIGDLSTSSAPSPAPWGCPPAPGGRAESTRPSRQSDPAPHIPGPARSSARLRSETTGRLPRRSPSPGRADSFGTQQCRGPVPHLLFAAGQTALVHPVEDGAQFLPVILGPYSSSSRSIWLREPPPYPPPQAGEGNSSA